MYDELCDDDTDSIENFRIIWCHPILHALKILSLLPFTKHNNKSHPKFWRSSYDVWSIARRCSMLSSALRFSLFAFRWKCNNKTIVESGTTKWFSLFYDVYSVYTHLCIYKQKRHWPIHWMNTKTFGNNL